VAAHHAKAREYSSEQPDPSVLAAQIRPALGDVPLRAIAAATGLSEHTAGHIRVGRHVPHPRHWDALRALARD
jgi:uncharacterized protein YidB (DUF937 family)